MTAQEAREKQRALMREQLEDVYTAIEEHIASGSANEYIFWYNDLTKDQIERLGGDGYKVQAKQDRNELYYVINWTVRIDS